MLKLDYETGKIEIDHLVLEPQVHIMELVCHIGSWTLYYDYEVAVLSEWLKEEELEDGELYWLQGQTDNYSLEIWFENNCLSSIVIWGLNCFNEREYDQKYLGDEYQTTQTWKCMSELVESIGGSSSYKWGYVGLGYLPNFNSIQIVVNYKAKDFSPVRFYDTTKESTPRSKWQMGGG